jgi:hypothetical protein
MSFFLDNIDSIMWVSGVATVIILLVKPPRPLTRSEAIKRALDAEADHQAAVADYVYRIQHPNRDNW